VITRKVQEELDQTLSSKRKKKRTLPSGILVLTLQSGRKVRRNLLLENYQRKKKVQTLSSEKT
jgi:hypothetical protein